MISQVSSIKELLDRFLLLVTLHLLVILHLLCYTTKEFSGLQLLGFVLVPDLIYIYTHTHIHVVYLYLCIFCLE